MPIRVLDAATVGRIAAGEVVERPSSVVKELIENSLDAGATSITVEIRGGGIDYLRVTDNGCGVEAGQVRLAFENHATSKLQRAEQLDDIRTLGFRGEALPSIAAVSRVEMTTRARGQESGMRFTSEGGKNIRLVEAGCPQGTTLVMRDLFFNVPVRRAFLKKPAYEGGLVSDAVSRLLLGNPNVSMRFISGGNTLFHSFGDGKLRHAVFSVYGRETAEKMIEMDASEGGTRIYGLIGVGELAKNTRSHQLFFINGRSVRCPLLSKALEAVCRSRVTIGMYPMCVLNLIIPPTGVDVNVHPNKLEVRFRDAEMMREACERLLESAFEGERVLEIEKLSAPKKGLERVSEVRELPLNAEKRVNEAVSASEASAETEKTRSNQSAKPTSESQTPSAVSKKAQFSQMEMELGRPTSRGLLRENEAAFTPMDDVKAIPLSGMRAFERADAGASSEGERNEIRGQDVSERKQLRHEPAQEPKPAPTETNETRGELPIFRVIGTAFKTYILVETGENLLLIDQHAAHERLQYEKYMARAQAGAASQRLLTPLILQVSAREMAVISENLDALAQAGYEVEPFGERDIRVNAVPFVMGRAELKPLFLQTLQSLSQLKNAAVDARRGEIMQMACKSAVKAGDSLSDSEIAALIQGMLETGAPPTCPHGRPVARALTKREIEKMFKRIQ